MYAHPSGTTLWTTLTRFTRRSCLFVLAAAVMVVVPAMRAQTVTATISGTVTDPKGALVQGATVTITDETTNSSRSTESTKDGTFSVPNLIPATYSVKVVAQGFAPKELTGIEIHSGDEIRLPTFALAVGATTDTVTVTSVAGQILSTENGQRTATLTYQDVQDLALTGRDTTELLKVLPGVAQVTTSNTGYNDLTMTTGVSALGSGLGINGAPYKGGAVLNMDGANVLDPGNDFASLASVNPEMTQEMQVETTNFGADQAGGPIVINATSRSGGDHYHGEGYINARNDIFNANDWVDNHTGHPKAGASYYYPGGSISGAIPHTNKKLFFYGGFELPFQDQGNLNVLKGSIPTPAMLRGDFTTDDSQNNVLCPGGFLNNTGQNVAAGGSTFAEGAWCNNVSQSTTIVNGSPVANPDYTVLPDGTIPVASTNAAPSSTTTSGGTIPTQFINQNMLDFAKVWPGAGTWNSPYIATTSQQITNNGGYNYYQPIINHDNGWMARGRIDYNWNSTNQLYVSYQQGFDRQLAAGCGTNFYSCGANVIEYPGGGLYKSTYSKVVNGHYVHIFSPTLTNEAIASWVWGNIPTVPQNPSADYRSTLGYPETSVFGHSPLAMPTFGGVQNGYIGVSEQPYWEPANYYIVQKATPTFADNLTKVWGRHTLKFGALTANTDNYQGNQSGTGPQGALTIGGSPSTNHNYYSGYYSSGGTPVGCAVTPSNPSPNCGGYAGGVGSYNPTVNFLTGNLTNYAETNIQTITDLAFQQVAFYANDQVKVNRQFSVELGLRFEHIGYWYDRQGAGLAVFYPNRVLPDWYSGKAAPGYYWHAIDAGVPLSGHPNRLGYLSPRVGISYDIFGNGKTVVRGGWGAYRFTEQSNDANLSPGALGTADGYVNFSATNFLPTNSSFRVSQINQLQPWVNCQVQCPSVAEGGFNPADYGVPLTYSYNFTIDQRLPWSMLLDLAYVGNSAQKMNDTGSALSGNISNYANQNKTPLYAYGSPSGPNGSWVGNPDPVTGKVVCNPENLGAPCSNLALTNSAYDFQPYGRIASTGCANGLNPNCLIYGANSVTAAQNVETSNYNALQAAVVKRAGPVTLNANFTWSKSLGTVNQWDPFHVHSNNGYDNLNRPFIFNSSYIYREPNFWHGERIVGGVVNGWTISGVSLWQKGGQTLPSISVLYDPTTLPSYTGTSYNQTTGNPWAYSSSTSTLGITQATYYGTNAGITVNSRPETSCNVKSGLVYHQLYRPCFVPAAFGQPGGQGLPFIAGQAFVENDLAVYKTFTIHEQNKVQFRLSAFNWLNHPLPALAPSGESNTEYYFMNYQTHAVYANDTSTEGGSQAAANGDPGSPINATTTYGNAGGNPSNLFGVQHYKTGAGGNSQRIVELDLKYTF